MLDQMLKRQNQGVVGGIQIFITAIDSDDWTGWLWRRFRYRLWTVATRLAIELGRAGKEAVIFEVAIREEVQLAEPRSRIHE